MKRKLTTLLLAMLIAVSFVMPTVSATELTNINNVPCGLNTQDFDAEILSNSNCNTNLGQVRNLSQLKEAIKARLNELKNNDCTNEELLNIVKEDCNLPEGLDLDKLTPENLEAAIKAADAKNCTANVKETTEVPPEDTAPNAAQPVTDDMQLTIPTVEATADAEPIPTDSVEPAMPIPTENPDAEVVEAATSVPQEAIVPEAAPTAVPTPQPTPEPTAAPTPTAMPTTAPVNESTETAGISSLEKKMVDLVNADRAAANLPPLTIDTDLTQYARMHSADMSANNYFSHTSPTKGSFSERLQNSNISVSSAGENIALYNSIDKAQAALMASDGHRANILGKSFTHVGIGIVWNEAKGAYYITQWFARK